MKHKPAPIEVSFLPCPRCKIPHHREIPCEQAEAAEIQIRSARSFKRPTTTKRVRLSRETRTKLTRGEHPLLTFMASVACPVQQGDVIQITPLLWIGITTIRRDLKKMEWIVDYVEHNERPRLLRQRTHALSFDAMKDRHAGKVDVIKDAEAAEESAYTTSTGSSMTNEPEAVPRDYAEKISIEAKREELRPWETAKQNIEAQITELEQDPVIGKRGSELRFMKTQLERIDQKVREDEAA